MAITESRVVKMHDTVWVKEKYGYSQYESTICCGLGCSVMLK